MKFRYFAFGAILTSLIFGSVIYKFRYTEATNPVKTGPRGGPGSIPTSITFGNSSTGGCLGRGICNASLVMPGGRTTPPSPSTSIPVTFSPISQTQCVFSFFLIDLQNAPGQSQQALNFQQNNYSFDFPYSVSVDNPIFVSWNLRSGAVLAAGSPSSVFPLVTGSGVVISDIITISYSMPVQAFVVFGNPRADGGCDMTTRGICSITPATQPQPPNSVPVTFALQSGNATELVMTFSMSDLQNAEGNTQVAFFQSGSYMFNNIFPIGGDPTVSGSQLFLPRTAVIKPTSPSKVTISTTGGVADTIFYNTN
jgi:hypothetical protein